MLQELIALLIVVAAVAYMAWRYLPAAWRQRLGRVHPGLEVDPSRILEAVAGKGDVWISPWPRAVAVYLMGKSGDPAYETFLSGMGEVRVPLLTETALWALSEISSRRGRGSGRPASRKEEPC